MKLDYLADGCPDCPLVRLYDFTPAEAGHLLIAIAALASGSADRVVVDRLTYVEVVGDCQLGLVRRDSDHGVVLRTGSAEFECAFTKGTWDNIAGLVAPFSDGASGFQWLARNPGQVSLLLSASGYW